MRTITLTALAAFGLSAAALAQEPLAFDQVDSDKDGMINVEEAAKVEGLDFAAADANQDGGIDRAEYEQAVS